MLEPVVMALAMVGITPPDTTTPVTVEIVALGHVDTPATQFVLSVTLEASGSTDDKARAALEVRKAALLKKLAAVGVTLLPGSPAKPAEKLNTFDVMTDTIDNETDPDAKVREKSTMSQGFSIVAGSRTAIVQAQELIEKTEGATVPDAPFSFIKDVPGARRAAKLDAITKAKADAQGYADSLGYTSASVVSVSERNDIGTLFATFSSAIIGARGKPAMFEPSRGDTVPTDVTVIVTFRLDGKK